MRFCANNLFDFDTASVSDVELSEMDQYMLHLLLTASESCMTAYDGYEPFKVFRTVVNLCTRDLSTFYFPSAKDRLYTDAADSPRRRGVQFVLASALGVLSHMMAPIAVNVAYESFQAHPLVEQDADLGPFSVPWGHFTDSSWRNDPLASKWEVIRSVKSAMNQDVENLRQLDASVRDSSHAAVTAVVPTSEEGDELVRILQSLDEGIADGVGGAADILGISELSIERGAVTSSGSMTDLGPVQFSVASAQTAGRSKCPRCWRVCSADGHLCVRCEDVTSSL
jgi:isoleucyl-tRNA synthetase